MIEIIVILYFLY